MSSDTVKIVFFFINMSTTIDGVSKKVISQFFELSKQKNQVYLIIASNDTIKYPKSRYYKIYRIKTPLKNNIINRIRYCINIASIFKNTISSLESDDILYFRYSDSFPLYFPINYLRRYRKCKLVTEHQTIERSEFFLTKNVLSYFSDVLFGKLLKSQSDGIIGVTDEITEYELGHLGDFPKPHTIIGNGIKVNSCPLRENLMTITEVINFLFVANVSSWHGIDRLIQGINNFKGKKTVNLHIVGNGNEIPNLKKIVESLKLSDCVFFHGFKTGDELDSLFNSCHIAVGSLGIHRKGLTMTSELKAREYCARGIPYIIACGDPDFPDDFPYIFRLPPDESPIDIESVINFAQKVCSDPDHPQKMRKYAEENLDWAIKMKKLKEFLETLVDEHQSV